MKVTCRVVCDFFDKSTGKRYASDIERGDWCYYHHTYKQVYKLQIVIAKKQPFDMVTVLSEKMIESLDDKIYCISFLSASYEWDTKRDILYTRKLKIKI